MTLLMSKTSTIPPPRTAEGSSSAGFLIEDDYAFPDGKKAKLVFGCESDETGEIFRSVHLTRT